MPNLLRNLRSIQSLTRENSWSSHSMSSLRWSTNSWWWSCRRRRRTGSSRARGTGWWLQQMLSWLLLRYPSWNLSRSRGKGLACHSNAREEPQGYVRQSLNLPMRGVRHRWDLERVGFRIRPRGTGSSRFQSFSSSSEAKQFAEGWRSKQKWRKRHWSTSWPWHSQI